MWSSPGLVGQSPDSLSIAEYLKALGNRSSRPASPSGDASEATVSVSEVCPASPNAHRAQQQFNRLNNWLARVDLDRPVVVEIGAGTAIPSVRHSSQRIIRQRGGRLIRINRRENTVPTPFDVGFAAGAAEMLIAIDRAMSGGTGSTESNLHEREAGWYVGAASRDQFWRPQYSIESCSTGHRSQNKTCAISPPYWVDFDYKFSRQGHLCDWHPTVSLLVHLY